MMHSRQKTQKAQKDKKASFPNESVQNADLHELLNKIMTTHE